MSLFEKPSMTQDQNMGVMENSAMNIDSVARSMWMTDFSDQFYVDDGIFHHTHILVLSHAWCF
jgi:hypothetical protein